MSALVFEYGGAAFGIWRALAALHSFFLGSSVCRDASNTARLCVGRLSIPVRLHKKRILFFIEWIRASRVGRAALPRLILSVVQFICQAAKFNILTFSLTLPSFHSWYRRAMKPRRSAAARSSSLSP